MLGKELIAFTPPPITVWVCSRCTLLFNRENMFSTQMSTQKLAWDKLKTTQINVSLAKHKLKRLWLAYLSNFKLYDQKNYSNCTSEEIEIWLNFFNLLFSHYLNTQIYLKILSFIGMLLSIRRIFFTAYCLPSSLFLHNTTWPKPPWPVHNTTPYSVN